MLDKDGMPQTEEVEVRIPAFRAVSVFDVSQTDGEPIPELEAKELLSTVEGYEDFKQAVMNVAPVPIGFEDFMYLDSLKDREDCMEWIRTMAKRMGAMTSTEEHELEKWIELIIGNRYGKEMAGYMIENIRKGDEDNMSTGLEQTRYGV